VHKSQQRKYSAILVVDLVHMSQKAYLTMKDAGDGEKKFERRELGEGEGWLGV